MKTQPLDPLSHIPGILWSAIREGDVLLQIADHGLYGEATRLLGQADADAKRVPLCQHAMVATIGRGGVRDLHVLESSWTVRERPFAQLDPGTYIVLRHKTATPTELEIGIDWGRTRINRRYGYESLVRIGLQLLFKLRLYRFEDQPYTICSEFVGDIYEHAMHPLNPLADEDADLKPWDFLCPPVVDRFEVFGQFTVPRLC